MIIKNAKIKIIFFKKKSRTQTYTPHFEGRVGIQWYPDFWIGSVFDFLDADIMPISKNDT